MIRHTTTALSLAIFLMSTAISRAGEPTTVPSSWPAAKAIDIDIQDPVTVQQYVDYVRERSGLNIVVMADSGTDIATLKLPPIRLTHVSAGQALTLVNSTPGAAVAIEENDDAEHGSKIYVVRIAQANRNQFGNETPPVPTTVMAVFPLEKLLLGESPKDRIPDDAERDKALNDRADQLLVLADQAFAMVPPSGEKPEFRYHSPTHTLLVKATEDDAERVKKLIEALEVPERTAAERVGKTVEEWTQLLREHDEFAKQNEWYARQLAISRAETQQAIESGSGLIARTPTTAVDSFDPSTFPNNGDLAKLTPEQRKAVLEARAVRVRAAATQRVR